MGARAHSKIATQFLPQLTSLHQLMPNKRLMYLHDTGGLVIGGAGRTCAQGHAHVDLLLVVKHLAKLDDVGVVQLLQHVHLFIILFRKQVNNTHTTNKNVISQKKKNKS